MQYFNQTLGTLTNYMKQINSFKHQLENRMPEIVSLFLCSVIAFSFTTQDFITAIGLLALVAYVLKPSLKIYTLNKYALTKYMLFALFWLVVVTATSQVAFMALNGLIILSTIPLMFLIATEIKNFEQVWRYLRIFFMLLAGVFSIWALYQVGHQIGKGHAEGPYNDRNTFASLMNALWFLTAWHYFRLAEKLNHEPLLKWVANQTAIIFLLFFVSLALFTTSSRGAMLVWFLLSPIMLYVSYRYTHSKQKIFAALIIIAIAYFTSGYLFESNVSNRTLELTKDTSTIARLQLWISTFYMAIDHPVFGVGWDNFQFFYPQYRYVQENNTAGMYAHNDYLQLAAEGGFIAITLIAGLLVFVLLRAKSLLLALIKMSAPTIVLPSTQKQLTQAQAYEALALLLGITAVMLHAGVNFIFYYSGVNIILALYLGRVATLTEHSSLLQLPKLAQIRPSIKSLLWKFAGVTVFTPFIIHAFLQLSFTGSQPALKLLKAAGVKLNGFNLASLTVNIYPHNFYAQKYLMQSYNALLNRPGKAGTPMDKQLLLAAIKDFDKFRSYNANSATIGTQEVRLIMRHLRLDDAQHNLRNKAYQILSENLKSNVYHSESYVLLARLQIMDGLNAQAEATIDDAAKHMLSMQDLIVVNLQYYIQHKKLNKADLVEVELMELDMLNIRDKAERGHIDQDVGKRFKKGQDLLKKLYERPSV